MMLLIVGGSICKCNFVQECMIRCLLPPQSVQDQVEYLEKWFQVSPDVIVKGMCILSVCIHPQSKLIIKRYIPSPNMYFVCRLSLDGDPFVLALFPIWVDWLKKREDVQL